MFRCVCEDVYVGWARGEQVSIWCSLDGPLWLGAAKPSLCLYVLIACLVVLPLCQTFYLLRGLEEVIPDQLFDYV